IVLAQLPRAGVARPQKGLVVSVADAGVRCKFVEYGAEALFALCVGKDGRNDFSANGFAAGARSDQRLEDGRFVSKGVGKQDLATIGSAYAPQHTPERASFSDGRVERAPGEN